MWGVKHILAAITFFAVPAQAQQQGVLDYTCEIEGETGRLMAQYEVIGGSGITTAPNGDISGVISTGQETIYYQGQLTTPRARYSFVGENAYADFTDLGSNARFRVELITNGDALALIVNPFGDQPLRYFCQRNG
jgi:hypothetical protein